MLLGSGHSDGIFKNMATSEFKDHPDCRCEPIEPEVWNIVEI